MHNITENRSNIEGNNLDEMLAANGRKTNRGGKLKGQQQYFTPLLLAQELGLKLYKKYKELLMARGRSRYDRIMLFDPQRGSGNFIKGMAQAARSFELPNVRGNIKVTCELDKNIIVDESTFESHTIADCVAFRTYANLLAEGKEITFDIGVANPPFGFEWQWDEYPKLDSVLWTWSMLYEWCNAGIVIGGSDKIDQIILGMDKGGVVVQWYDAVHDLEKHFEGVKFPISAVMWIKSEDKIRTPKAETGINFWQNVSHVVAEETKKSRPEFNIDISYKGYLKVYLSTLVRQTLDITPASVKKLQLLQDQHPYTLAADNEQRKLMQEFLDNKLWNISPRAERVIQDAIDESFRLSCPIMPITDFEHIAYADDMEQLTCRVTTAGFVQGERYETSSHTYTFSQQFTRIKRHYNEETGESFMKTHRCELTGTDKKIEVVDGDAQRCSFVPNIKDARNDLGIYHEDQLWDIFEKPIVNTVKEMKAELIEGILKEMDAIELLADFTYYPGQRDFYSRVAAKLCALVAAATGTGKTLGAITLALLSRADRCLIIAPQGTTKDTESESPEGMSASQWLEEIERFAPFADVYRLFSYQDYLDLKAEHGGELPHGIYISYYEAMFYNATTGKGRAMERLPDSWNDIKLCKHFDLPLYDCGDGLKDEDGNDKSLVILCETVGEEVNGIKCIASPSMSTLISDEFEFIAFDEAHKMAKLSSIITDTAIRMQCKYRYAFTATPIPNTISDIFSLMGWLCVADWHKGGLCNAAFPFRREDKARFDELFLCEERDHTAEAMKVAANPKWKGQCKKKSPVIASPSRLLKIIKSTVAYISKEQCNPDYVKPIIRDIRVPMGKQQAALYDHYTNRGNIPHKNAMVAAGMQINYLRGICADPVGVDYNNVEGMIVQSNFNPKVISTLEMIQELMSNGHQVVIINSRTGLSSEIQDRLAQAGIECARIDGTVPAKQHSVMANRFKKKEIPVLLMGIKCAIGHSFDDCKHLIICSLEYSYGTFQQAIGRVDRITSRESLIYCVLHKDTIEDHMFDVVATKGDAATICLVGERVPRDFKPVDMGEVLANSILKGREDNEPDEIELEKKWPHLKLALQAVSNVWSQ